MRKYIKCEIILGGMLFILLSVSSLFADDYYVSSTTGDDSRSPEQAQNQGTPWRTIQKGSDMASAGDTVHVAAGTYYERIDISTSGSSGSPITIEGTRGSSGKYLTIIDGSDATGTWVAAPEIGTGVYKIDLGYIPYAMLIDGNKNVQHIHDDKVAAGMKFLKHSASATFVDEWADTDVDINYWDGVNAWFGYKPSTDRTYIKIVDDGDSNPNNRSVRSSPGNVASLNTFPLGQVIEIDNQNYNTIKDFSIRGARIGVVMRNAGSHHNIIEDCEILTGTGRVHIRNSAHDNIIRNNDMYNNMLGFDEYPPGPWGRESSVKTTDIADYYAMGVHQNIYTNVKYIGGNSQEENADCGVYVWLAGDDNEVSGNSIHGGTAGITLFSSDGTKIHNNTIYNMSHEAIYIYWNVYDTEIYDNTFHTNNINVRFAALHKGNRSIYLYRNKFYNPEFQGELMYFHSQDGGPPSNPADLYIYHNSFSGGGWTLGMNLYIDDIQGFSNAYFINNVFSGTQITGSWMSYIKNTSMGLFAYNWIGGTYKYTPSWIDGVGNIKTQYSIIWDVSSLPEFKLSVDSTGSNAIGAGIDLSKPNTIAGKNIPALPGMDSGYFEGSAPDMGWGSLSSQLISPPYEFRMVSY
ncbi:MAG: hypothetical protein GY928_08010 [Colwellia sp.]|nr:hypothetical protein [Colwellia sp.]